MEKWLYRVGKSLIFCTFSDLPQRGSQFLNHGKLKFSQIMQKREFFIICTSLIILRKITVQSWKNDSTEVSELGLSQILREKIIVSNTQIFHQIIKIWHAIRHLEKILDPKIQKWLRYRLLNKKPKFSCTYLSRTLHPNFS